MSHNSKNSPIVKKDDFWNEGTSDRNKSPIIAGTGLLALDIVFNGDLKDTPGLWAGGSCGNVLTILSYLGWHSYPIARLGKDIAATKIQNDLINFGLKLDFIENDKKVNTPIIIERIRNNADGIPTHRFFMICPNCGTWLPRYRSILQKKVQQLSSKLPMMQCYYFDRVSPASIELADKARQSGALVVFEPSRINDEIQYNKAIQLSHILKYSQDIIYSMEGKTKEKPTNLLIETMGADGIRYQLLEENGSFCKWRSLSAFNVDDLRDAAGAGDWCTAGIIHLLGRAGAKGLIEASENEVTKAILFGQAMASLNCCFDGARGCMYSLEKEAFEREIVYIMEHQDVRNPISEAISEEMITFLKCICPSCKEKKKTIIG